MSIRNIPTLKGVFPRPKSPPKRDFLRENKLKLKDLQRHIKQSQSENDHNPSTAEKHFFRRNKLSARSNSVGRKGINSECSCASSSKKIKSSININSTKQLSGKVVHCDKSIQTDEINDEAFLSDALKRCYSRSDLNFRPNSNVNSNEKGSPTEHIHLPYISNENQSTEIHRDNENNDIIPDLATLNLDLKKFKNEEESMVPSAVPSAVDQNRNCGNQREQELIKEKLHKFIGPRELGNRSDLHLPKYLEREKRERELRRIKELERDPHCPEGHYVLNEAARQEALKIAQKRFQEFVNELNRMPMSSETFRTRNRKMEIEKALVELESTIRSFSKAKVYIKCDD